MKIQELQEKLVKHGIPYMPAESVFFSEYPFKILLNDNFYHVDWNISWSINLDESEENIIRSLDFYREKVMKKVQAKKQLEEHMHEFMNQLKEQTKKTLRRGYTTFYFKTADAVNLFADAFYQDIKRVVGPISESHSNAIKEKKTNTIVKNNLFFSKYRYSLTFAKTKEFCNECYPVINKKLEKTNSWSGMNWDDIFVDSWNVGFVSANTHLYFENEEDFVYIKLLAGEYVNNSREVVLVDEVR